MVCSVLEFGFECGRLAGLGQNIEAVAAQDGSGGSFYVNAPRAGFDAALHRIGPISSIASAANRKRNAVGGDPAAPAVVGLPFMNDLGIQRCRRENSAVKVDR